MRVEEEHLDVLQNIESTVSSFYRNNPELTDFPVLRTYEALVKYYSDESKGGRTPELAEVPGMEGDLLRDVNSNYNTNCTYKKHHFKAYLTDSYNISLTWNWNKHICECRMGRSKMTTTEGIDVNLGPVDASTLVVCLKRLVKSVKTWNKHGGRRGYLDFMTKYVK